MTLLREIQDAATNENVSLAVVLRKCKILATRLKHEPFRKWVDLMPLPHMQIHDL